MLATFWYFDEVLDLIFDAMYRVLLNWVFCEVMKSKEVWHKTFNGFVLRYVPYALFA